jgi:hypothetical protein
VKTKPKKTNKISPHISLLKADLEKIHFFKFKNNENTTAKTQIHSHTVHAPSPASHTLLKSTSMTIDTHALIDLWWRQEKEGERVQREKEKVRREW